jgi:hypothetical protein
MLLKIPLQALSQTTLIDPQGALLHNKVDQENMHLIINVMKFSLTLLLLEGSFRAEWRKKTIMLME